MVAIALALCSPTSASLTPPPTGDWTILAGENAVISSGSTVVTGNVTVQGSLTVRNATLELDGPAAGAVPRLSVEGPAVFVVDNSTLRAGPLLASRMLLDATAGASLTLRNAAVRGLGNATQGVMSQVGARLVGATVQIFDTRIDGSEGGLGLDQASSLVARNVTIVVQLRALLLSGNSTADIVGITAVGNFSASDFLVLADHGTLNVANANLSNATTVLLLLSSTGVFTNATFERANHTAVLLVGATLDLNGGLVAPRALSTIGMEAYGSTLRLTARFQNYTYGISVLGSKLWVSNSSFATSNETPKSSFAGVYAFDSNVTISNASFNGSYYVTDVQLVINGTPQFNLTTGLPIMVPVFACSNSAMWLVRSQSTVMDATTVCFNDHYHAEDTDSFISSLSLRDGNRGLTIFHGTIDAWNITGTQFSKGSGADIIGFTEASGIVRNLKGSDNSVGVELQDSTVTLEGFVSVAQGLGVLVVSGAPVITGSTFTVHNGTSVWVQGGNPTILNSTFWLSADRQDTEGVNVTGGAPRVEGNTFHGTFVLTAGVRVWGGTPSVVGNRFFTLDRGAVFYAKGFLAEGNFAQDCRAGIEAREGSSGTIRGNTFDNLTEVGYGTGVNVFKAGALVEANTFVNVNYGIKYFNYTAAEPAGARISGNFFDRIGLYAIEVYSVSRAMLIDNNTVRGAGRGGIEVLFSNVVSAYNVVFDSPVYGYELTLSNLTMVGGRLENLSEGIHANQSNLDISYTTFLLNGRGMIVQDGRATIRNSSFQFNGIAVSFPSNLALEVVDSIFVGNVEGVLSYYFAEVRIRDSNFVGTLDYILQNNGDSTGRIEFTRRGELNGGRFLLRGQLVSTASALTLKSVKMLFANPLGELPGVSVRFAQSLVVSSVSLANSSVPFFLEIEDSEGSLTQVNIRGALSAIGRPGMGPYFANSTLTLRDVAVNDSAGNFTLFDTALAGANFTVRDGTGAGLVLNGSSLSGSAMAFLDNALCGIHATRGSTLNATNLTVRGNLKGSLCFDASRAFVAEGDFASGSLDLNLTGGSVVDVVSTTIARGWRVVDTSKLSISWYIAVRVTYPNALLLPFVLVTVLDAKGLAVLGAPGTDGEVGGLPPFPERIVTSSGADVRTPYLVGASFANSTASASVALTQDRLVQLDLADRTAPRITIDAPTEGAGFASATVVFRFSAGDAGSGIETLQYRFGAGSFTAIAPSPLEIEVARDLVDGDHQFVVRAVDFAGNVAEVMVNITVDTRAPLISLVSPRSPGNLTRLANITVQVTVEADVALLTIGGVPVAFVGGSASRLVDLPEGPSQIVIEATDRVGNRANISVFVASDRTPPVLEVEYSGNSTVESFIVIKGHAEVGSQVQVGGLAVPLDNGSFEVLVLLDEGRNEIDIKAKDSLQNENLTRLTITRGVLQPSHVLDIVAEVVGAVLLVAAGALLFLFFRRAGARRSGPPGGGEAA